MTRWLELAIVRFSLMISVRVGSRGLIDDQLPPQLHELEFGRPCKEPGPLLPLW